ncbi:MAG: putative toxin-antitoxin system toxin component, PIN family [Phycisphaerae bacterium]
MKVVLDTNVLVAAFAARGLCEAVLEVCLTGHDLALSEHILTELRRHLRRTLKVPPAHADAVVAFLREQAEVVRPADVPADACRDPSDLPVLGTAVAAEADCLVTGDADLLDLDAYEGVAILSPRAFHDGLK